MHQPQPPPPSATLPNSSTAETETSTQLIDQPQHSFDTAPSTSECHTASAEAAQSVGPLASSTHSTEAAKETEGTTQQPTNKLLIAGLNRTWTQGELEMYLRETKVGGVVLSILIMVCIFSGSFFFGCLCTHNIHIFRHLHVAASQTTEHESWLCHCRI
jgi:cytochrome c2